VGSKPWLDVSLDCVQEFLRMDCLDIVEAELVRALMKWGKFQLQKNGEDPNDGQKLRDKVLPGLHLIRFAAVNHSEFAQLCLEELGTVLSGDEKHSIMMSIITGDWELMPVEIVPTKLALRLKPDLVFHLRPLALMSPNYDHIEDYGSHNFKFQLNKRATMVGLKIEPPRVLQSLSINLTVRHNYTYASGREKWTLREFSLVGDSFYKLTPRWPY
jgi:hypothetical protein